MAAATTEAKKKTAAEKKSSKGKVQHANTQRGRLQRPNLDAYYGEAVRALEPGNVFTFRTILIRPELKRDEGRYMVLDRAETMLEWGEGEGSLLQGTLSLRRPAAERVASIPVERGHRVRLQLWWGGRWVVMWDMQVQGVPPVSLPAGTLNVELADPLSALHMNEREWEFKKDKQHPKGWTADQITRYVCKEEKVRVGALAKGKHLIKKLKVKKGSGLEVIRTAWAQEKKQTTQRYIIRFRDGKLTVLPFKRPKTAYVIGGGIEKEAETQAEGATLHPVTSIKAIGHVKTGKGKTRKVEETITSKPAAARFGFSQKELDYGRVDSQKELREEAQRDLAEEVKLERTASLTVPGIPFLEKGSTIIWRTDEPGWHGKVGNIDRAFAFVTNAHHTLNPADYDTELVISQDDIYFDDAEARNQERRKEKKKERKGRKSKGKTKKEEEEETEAE